MEGRELFWFGVSANKMKDVEAEIWNYGEDFTKLIRQSGHPGC
jgi:hypothetical protein